MAFSMRQAIPRKLNRLAGISKVQAALQVMHPEPAADEFSCLAMGADPDIWNFIAAIGI